MNNYPSINQIRPRFYSTSITAGKVDLVPTRDFICFLIVEHIDDETFIKEQVDSILFAGCKGFEIYGSNESRWHYFIDQEDIRLSYDGVQFAYSAGWNSKPSFVHTLFRALNDERPIKNDIYLIYDDEKVYEDVLEKVTEKEWRRDHWHQSKPLKSVPDAARPLHLRDIVGDINVVEVCGNMESAHFVTVDCEDEYECDDPKLIAAGGPKLDYPDSMLLTLKDEIIHAFTNIEMLDRMYRLAKDRLNQDQLRTIETVHHSCNVEVDEKDIDYLLAKIVTCDSIFATPSVKKVKWWNYRDRRGMDEIIPEIITQLKATDFIPETSRYSISHTSANVIRLRPATITIGKHVLTKPTILIRIDLEDYEDEEDGEWTDTYVALAIKCDDERNAVN